MYKFTSFSLYFSFFLSVSAFFHVYFFLIIFFLKFSSDYWGGKKGVLPPHPNYWGGACPGCPPRVYAYDDVNLYFHVWVSVKMLFHCSHQDTLLRCYPKPLDHPKPKRVRFIHQPVGSAVLCCPLEFPVCLVLLGLLSCCPALSSLSFDLLTSIVDFNNLATSTLLDTRIRSRRKLYTKIYSCTILC